MIGVLTILGLPFTNLFVDVVDSVMLYDRAIDSCKSQEINVDDHFRKVTKMVGLGS